MLGIVRPAQAALKVGGWTKTRPGSLGLLPSGPDPVGEWCVPRQPPGALCGPCRRGAQGRPERDERVRRYTDCRHRYILTDIKERLVSAPRSGLLREKTMSPNGGLRHADRIHLAVSSDEAAKSALVASWRRSAALHHLNPAERGPPKRLTDAGLREARRTPQRGETRRAQRNSRRNGDR